MNPNLLLAATLLAVLLVSLSPAIAGTERSLSVEAIYGDELGGPHFSSARWAPDGQRLVYQIDDREESRELWLADLRSGEKRLLLGPDVLERLAGSSRQGGPTRTAVYHWSPDGKALLVAESAGGRVGLLRVESGEETNLTPEEWGSTDAKFSPDGAWVSFVRDHDLWIVPAGGGEARRLTSGGSETLLHGEADWVYTEEFDVRTGYHWSPDGNFIAFLEMDEQSVPRYALLDESKLQATVNWQHYPKPGEPNPRVRVGIVEIESGRTAWIDRRAEYVPRIDWADTGTVAVQLLNRAQTELELILADPRTGRSRPLLVERDEHWVNVTHDLTFLDGGEELLWSSERSGYRHIYRYRRDGTLLARLTEGQWEVCGIEGVDEAGGWVYFTSEEDNRLGNDLYRVALDGGARERLTADHGTHRITLNEQGTAYLDEFSSKSTPPRKLLRAVGGDSGILLHEVPPVDDLGLVEPEFVELRASDGGLVRVKLLKPRHIAAGSKLPVLVYVYGGPRSPVVRDSWRHQSELFHQLLVQRGFVVAAVDDRASSLMGHKHEIALSRNWGPVAAEDHRVAVDYLRSLPFVDPERLAVWGWSGGGYTTCYHMTRTGLFKVGVAVAPVTDWTLYDSIYTERYMGLPEDEPEAYERTSILGAAEGLSGKLLLVHGTGDDNVHPQNTTRLLRELIDAGRPVDLMLYPNKRHGIRGAEDRIHLFNKIVAYLEENL
jgi:dipeptidyl-peptidase-4